MPLSVGVGELTLKVGWVLMGLCVSDLTNKPEDGGRGGGGGGEGGGADGGYRDFTRWGIVTSANKAEQIDKLGCARQNGARLT